MKKKEGRITKKSTKCKEDQRNGTRHESKQMKKDELTKPLNGHLKANSNLNSFLEHLKIVFVVVRDNHVWYGYYSLVSLLNPDTDLPSFNGSV